jgi:hypothetical protein
MGIMIAVIALAAAQPAADPAPSASERRLTPEQVEAILEEAASKRLAEERRAYEPQPSPEVAADPPPSPIFGEFGLSVGTGGYREVFGTGIYPMSNGGAAVTFDFVDWGDRRYPYRY